MRLSLFPFLFLAIPSMAQQPDLLVSWPVTYTMNPGMPRHVLASSGNGNLMSARLMSAAFIYGQDIMGTCAVERIDPGTGQALWSCMLFDSATVDCGAVDEDGNVYVAGKFMGPLGFCDGSILGHTGAGWDLDLYLIKFDPTGLLLWSRNISVNDPQASMISAITIDPQGRAWCATSDFNLTRISRLDEQGNDAEIRFIDGAKMIGGLDFSPSGAMYVSGAAGLGGFAFGGTATQAPFTYNMFLLRYDAADQADWVEFAEDVTFQQPSIAVDLEGNAFVAGSMFNPSSWGSILFNGPNWVNNAFLAKADSSGQFLWGVESAPASGPINGDLTSAARTMVDLDSQGHAYITGTLRGTVDWGNGVVSNGITSGVNTQTIVSFDVDGTAQWAATSMPNAAFTTAMAIATFDDGTVFFSAHASGEYVFTPLATGMAGQQSYVVGRISSGSTGAEEIHAGAAIVVGPVPASDRVTIVLPDQRARGILVDMSGQEVMHLSLRSGLNTLDVTPLDAGLYLLRLSDGRTVRVVKD